MKKLFVSALAVALVFSSCTKDSGNGNGTGNGTDGDGVGTKLGLTLTFPRSEGTRATDTENATPDEMNVNSIHLFIFNSDGTAANAVNPIEMTLSDFTVVNNATNDTYTLKHSKRVTTTTGTKRIYVGINLSDEFLDGFDATYTESKLNDYFETTLAKLIDADPTAVSKKRYISGNKFEMFTDVVATPSLVAETDPNWSNTNMVEVEVIRQAAKMTADFGMRSGVAVTPTTVTNWYFTDANINPSGANLVPYGVHTMNGYYLGQAALNKMYRYAQYNVAGKRITPTCPDPSSVTDPKETGLMGLGYTWHYFPVNANGLSIKAPQPADVNNVQATERTSYFGIENVSLNSIRKETTVAVFWTSFVPAYATVYDESETIGSGRSGWYMQDWNTNSTANPDAHIGQVVATPAVFDGEPNPIDVEPGSFWAVKDGTDYRFFYTQEQANNFARDMNLDGYTPQLREGILYQKGHSYFYVYLRNTQTQECEFVRNQYYQLLIQGIESLGTPGTLKPVDPTDPEYPTDPDDPNPPTPPTIPPGEPDPTVPDPEEPTPGEEDETTFRVDIVVRQWDLHVMDGLKLTK